MTTIKKITTLFLLIVFLLSSLGFTLNKMVCLKSGKVKISLTKLKDCCPEKKSSGAVIKTNCCDINNTFFHLSDFHSSQKSSVPAANDYVLTVHNYLLTNKNYNTSTSKLAFADLPPPFYGRQLLSFISILII